MKQKHRKMWRSVIALVLAFTLVFGMSTTAFAGTGVNMKEGDDVLNYVSFGASQTNGYGMRGYLEDSVYQDPASFNKDTFNVYGYQMKPETAYPYMLSKKLEEMTGKEVKLDQLAMSSMRAEEVRVLLDDNYDGDAYTRWRFTAGHNWFERAGGLDNLRNEYQEAVKNADLITLEMGVNNFGVYAVNQMTSSGTMFDTKLSDVFSPEDLEKYYEAKAEITTLLKEEYGYEDEGTLDLLADTFTYAYAGFIISFDEVVKLIREMNPDTQIVVLSIPNMLYGVEAEMPGIEGTVPMGDIFGAVIKMANLYTESLSPYNDQYLYALAGKDGHVETFLDEILTYNGDPETLTLNMEDCFDIYDDDLKVRVRVQQIFADFVKQNTGKTLQEWGFANVQEFADMGAAGLLPANFMQFYEMYDKALNTAYDVVAKIMKAGAEHNLVNLEAVISGEYESKGAVALAYIEQSFLEGMNAVANGLPFEFEFDQTLLEDPALGTVFCMGVRNSIGNSFFAHPNEAGHKEVLAAILAALEDGKTGEESSYDNLYAALIATKDFIVEYYDDAYAYAYQYALENGYVAETVEGIDEAIAAMEAIRAELETVESDMTDEFRAEVLAEIDEIIETLEAAKALVEEADVLDQASLDALMALLNEAGQDMNQLYNTLEQAAVDVKDLVIIPALEEAYDILINEVIPQAKEQLTIAIEKGAEWLIDKIKEALPKVDKALYDWLYNNPETVIGFFVEYSEEIDAIINEYGADAAEIIGYVLITYGPDAVEWALENPEEAIAKWVEWYNKHGQKVWPMIDKYIQTMDEMGMFDDVKQALNDAYAEVEAMIIAYAEKVVAELEAMIDELDAAAKAALEELKAAIEDAKNGVDNAVAEILAALEELYEQGVIAYEGATTGYYAATEDSYYVALGDTGVEYAQIVADELDLDKEQFMNYGIEDMTAAELKAYLQAGDEELIAEIENADLITLGFSNNTITKFAADKLAAVMAGEEVEMDWTPYVGKDGAAAMAKAIAAIEDALVAEGADAATINMATTVVEAYAFACTEFACNYPEAINAIKAINPEAQVVVVGMYNPFDGAVLDIEGTQIPVGEFVNVLVELANVHYLSYAMLTGNAVYVAAPDVEVEVPFEGAMDIAAFAAVLTDLDSLEPSAAGNEYIAQQILDALNVVSKAVYDAQKLIDEIKAFGDVTRDNLADAKALAEAAREAWDKLTDEEKALIGLDAYKALVEFELKIAEVELELAKDIEKAEAALAAAQAKLADIERALKITESTVTDLKAKVVNKSQIKVTWEAAAVEPDQYRVTLMRAGVKVGTYWVAGDKETVTLKNLLRGTNFTVRVTPVAKVEGKKYFSIYKTSNKVKTQLQKANLTVKKAGLKKQIISKDQNSTGFQIYISKDKNFKKDVKKLVYKTNKKGLNVKVKAKNFKKGTNYVKVRAYTKVNGKTVYGAWSGTVKVTK